MNSTAGMNNAGMQGQRTGAAGKGPDMICKSASNTYNPIPQKKSQQPNNKDWRNVFSNLTVLDKLEHKFGGQRFNDPNNDAKNRAMNQKLAKRIMTIAPKVL